jgi:acyl dehydratase
MKKYWDSIEIGQVFTPINKKPTNRLHLAHFAAASDDFSPLHLDDDYAKNAGYGGVFVPSLIALGLAEDALRAFAHNITIVSLSGTFQRLIWPGDSLTTKGVIIRRYKKHEEHRAQFSLWVENQNHEVVMKGQAIAAFFKNESEESKTKLSAPPVAKAAHEAFLEKCKKLNKKPQEIA